MGIVNQLFDKVENRYSLADLDKWMSMAYSGLETKSGVKVNEFSAMQQATVWACVRVRARGVASLPVHVFERTGARSKELALNHPLYRLLHTQPNPEMSSFELRELLEAHESLWGNAYAELQSNGRGEIMALWPLPPWRTKPKRVQGTVMYELTLPTGETRLLPAENVLHIKGQTLDGLNGLSPIAYQRETVGLALATEEFGNRFYKDGTHIGGIIEYPEALSDKGVEQYEKSVREKYSGLSKSHRLMVLEEGLTYHQVGIPPEDAQYLETRKFSKREIASFYNVKPHKIGDLEDATYSNIEQQNLEHVIDTLRPLLVRWEQAMQVRLFTRPEQERYFIKFIVEGLLRGDSQARAEFYSKMFQSGFYSINDVRELEDKNPVDGGDEHFVPVNMFPLARAKEVIPEPPPELEDDERALREWRDKQIQATEDYPRRAAATRRRLGMAMEPVFEAQAADLIADERQAIMQAAEEMLSERNRFEFDQFVEDYYNEHPERISRKLGPAFTTLAEQVRAEAVEEVNGSATEDDIRSFVGDYEQSYTRRHIGYSQSHVRNVVNNALAANDDPVKALNTEFDEWEEKRPHDIARRETSRLHNAAAKKVFALAGVAQLRWQAFGENCPYCDDLNGKTVGIDTPFLNAGDSFEPDAADRPLTVRINVGHPPAHDGCDCSISAVF